ncbi:MAG: SIS domain-containing protein [Oscillospiraceae bacterium]
MTKHLDELIARYPTLSVCREDIAAAAEVLCTSYRLGGKLLVCGNGGSAADSEHIVGELMKGFLLARPVDGSLREKLLAAYPDEGDYLADNLQGALPAISLVSHSALSTAFSNDIAPDMVFAQQVFGYGKPGDVFLGISTSGNAANVLHAAQVAKARGMVAVGLTGRSGGKMAGACDICIRVPADSTPHVQEYHLPVYHALCSMVEQTFFG